jgi:hypothetical protein
MNESSAMPPSFQASIPVPAQAQAVPAAVPDELKASPVPSVSRLFARMFGPAAVNAHDTPFEQTEWQETEWQETRSLPPLP